MLKITIPSREMFNEKTQEFFHVHEYTIQLEHSLVSVSKWESKWNKPFLAKEKKTIDETIDEKDRKNRIRALELLAKVCRVGATDEKTEVHINFGFNFSDDTTNDVDGISE